MYKTVTEAYAASYEMLQKILNTGKDCKLVFDMSVYVTDIDYKAADDAGILLKRSAYYKPNVIVFKNGKDDTCSFNIAADKSLPWKLDELQIAISKKDNRAIRFLQLDYFEEDGYKTSMTLDFHDLFKMKIKPQENVVTENEIVPLNIDL